MAIKYEIAFPKEYKSNGETKKYSMKIGVVLETKNGLLMKRESIPIGRDGVAFLNEPKAKDALVPQQQRQQQAPLSDDDIPF